MRKKTEVVLEIAKLRNDLKRAKDDDDKAALVDRLLELEKEVKKLEKEFK